MSTTDTFSPTDTVASDLPEQLSLLTAAVPLQFRLDERTRVAGLQHVAELRRLMIAQAAGRRAQSKPSFRRDAGHTNQIAA
jgi:hypothetical protein